MRGRTKPGYVSPARICLPTRSAGLERRCLIGVDLRDGLMPFCRDPIAVESKRERWRPDARRESNCERHHARVVRTVDPDQAVLLVHFGGHVAQPILILSEHFRDPGDGVDVVNLVDRDQDQILKNINAAHPRQQ